MPSIPYGVQTTVAAACTPTPAEVQAAYQEALDCMQSFPTTTQARAAGTRAIETMESYLAHSTASTFDNKYAERVRTGLLPILREEFEREAICNLQAAFAAWLQCPDSNDFSAKLISLIEQELSYLGVTERGLAVRAVLEQTYELFVLASFVGGSVSFA